MKKSHCKLRACAAILTACLCAILNCVPSLAATLFYAFDGGPGESGSVETALPLAKLGSLTLPRGRFVVHGDSVEVSEIPEWNFDRHNVLTGTVLDTRENSTAAGSRIEGVVFFQDGEWLKYYDSPNAVDSLRTRAGSVNGRITGVSESAITVASITGKIELVPLAEITDINSARAFRFAIAAAHLPQAAPGVTVETQAQAVSLRPTGTPFQLPQLKARIKQETDDGDVPTGKLVAVGAFLSLVELGQLAPFIAIPASSSHLSRQMLKRELLNNSGSN